MISSRKKYEIDQGEGWTLHKIVYESPDCDIHSPESEYYYMEILKALASNQSLLMCGSTMCENLVIKHLHGKWNVTMTTLEKKE